jgi:hypothetical protein
MYTNKDSRSEKENCPRIFLLIAFQAEIPSVTPFFTQFQLFKKYHPCCILFPRR